MSVWGTDEYGQLTKYAGGCEIRSALPVGAIFASAIPLTDSSVHALDGSLISQTGMYAEFANLIKSLVSAGYNIACEEQEFQDTVTQYGQCGKFVINNNSNTIRLPKVTKFIEGLSNLTDIGAVNSAGLPNITGEFGMVNAYNTYLVSCNEALKGAFITNPTGRAAYYSTDKTEPTSTNATAWTDRVSFNANSGASTKGIYGNSDTVQPESVSYPYYIVLLNGFDNTASGEGSETINTYSMVPSGNYEDMGIDFSTTGYHPTYTAPANGYVHIYFVGSASYLWVANRNANFECSLPNRANSGIVIPVSKGDVIQFYSDKAGNTTYSYSRFIYAKE